MSIPERFKMRQYSPVDVFGQEAVDWQERVNFQRLREQRLARTREMMREAGLPAIVILDINAAGPGGYYIDFVRTLLVGNKPTPEQRDSYKRCHELLQNTLGAMKAGVSTREVAEHIPKDQDDALKTISLVSQGHAIGLSLADGRWISRGFSIDFPTVLEADMVFAVETYWGDPKSEQAARLEDNVVVTESGCERFSLFEYEDVLLT
jgi:Xaa-Pro aminopeptidase